ncbi:Adenylosuccinate synthetase [compost metagenome]
MRPLYEELPGFRGELGGARTMDELPEDARRYVARIEELAGVPITIVSLGPERTQTITLADPWR